MLRFPGEEVSGMGKKRFLLLTLLLALALLLPCGVHGVRLAKIEASWRPLEGVRFRQDSPASARRAMEEAGIDPAVPGVGGEKLTFSPPMSMTVEDLAGTPIILSRQDVVESDFVSWSHDSRRERMAELTVNGSRRFLRLSTTQLNILYLAALRQNGREEQFRQDTGKGPGWFSGKSALERLDRQLFAAAPGLGLSLRPAAGAGHPYPGGAAGPASGGDRSDPRLPGLGGPPGPAAAPGGGPGEPGALGQSVGAAPPVPQSGGIGK